jgi:hypothetical protein
MEQHIYAIGTYCLVQTPDDVKKQYGFILNRKISPSPNSRGGSEYLYLVAHTYGITWLGTVKPAPEPIDKSKLNLPTPLDVDYRDLCAGDTEPLYGDYCYGWDYIGVDYRF